MLHLFNWEPEILNLDIKILSLFTAQFYPVSHTLSFSLSLWHTVSLLLFLIITYSHSIFDFTLLTTLYLL